MNKAKLNIGPNLFNWQPEKWRDFYFEVADVAPIDKVFLGEVICSKRAPLFYGEFDKVVERLEKAGKQIVFSTLAEVTSNVDRRLMEKQANDKNFFIEANDIAALFFLKNKKHAIGSYVNCYNEDALEFFAKNGATNICLNPEMPKSGIEALNKIAKQLDVELEVQIFGRIGLALSARCYHARAHDRVKDTCKFICDIDEDGMDLTTLEGQRFLTINGIQTMSYTYLNLVNEISELQEIGINNFRLSPHSSGTIKASKVFRSLLDGEIDKEGASAMLDEQDLGAPYSNGFYHGIAGYEWRV
ncbi:MAG: U32 family peptidase [Devosiaceae bacterium]|nr:U32 family peptidase [Devosiaceae bacterium]